MLKMLNPDRQMRLNINQVERHRWFSGTIVFEYSAVDDSWRHEIIEKCAKQFDYTPEQIEYHITSSPYGPIGGIYNIEMHQHHLKSIKLNKITNHWLVSNMKVINQFLFFSFALRFHNKLALYSPEHARSRSISNASTDNIDRLSVAIGH